MESAGRLHSKQGMALVLLVQQQTASVGMLLECPLLSCRGPGLELFMLLTQEDCVCADLLGGQGRRLMP